MTYAKPRVSLIGNAKEMIASIMQKTQQPSTDGPKHNLPAYDLDE
jgi:hypothetical protein